MKLSVAIFSMAALLVGCARPAVMQPTVHPAPHWDGPRELPVDGSGSKQAKPQPQQATPCDCTACWESFKEKAAAASGVAGEYYEAGREWLHEATAPDCKENPQAEGCKK